jgi:hypothetical protein
LNVTEDGREFGLRFPLRLEAAVAELLASAVGCRHVHDERPRAVRLLLD